MSEFVRYFRLTLAFGCLCYISLLGQGMSLTVQERSLGEILPGAQADTMIISADTVYAIGERR